MGKSRLRIISCPLPVKAPWLNAIEPKWVHGKRAIVEPERKLMAAEVVDRVCATEEDVPIVVEMRGGSPV